MYAEKMKYLLIPAILFLSLTPVLGNDNATWVLREPRAWGAIVKYCVACHNADVIDRADYDKGGWDRRIYQCYLYMSSRGYPRPTELDRQALREFLSQVTPKDQKPPVYMWPPKQGSLAVP